MTDILLLSVCANIWHAATTELDDILFCAKYKEVDIIHFPVTKAQTPAFNINKWYNTELQMTWLLTAEKWANITETIFGWMI